MLRDEPEYYTRFPFLIGTVRTGSFARSFGGAFSGFHSS